MYTRRNSTNTTCQCKKTRGGEKRFVVAVGITKSDSKRMDLICREIDRQSIPCLVDADGCIYQDRLGTKHCKRSKKQQ